MLEFGAGDLGRHPMLQVSRLLRAFSAINSAFRMVALFFLATIWPFVAVTVVVSASGSDRWAPAVRYPLAAGTLALANTNIGSVGGATAVAANPAGLTGTPGNEALATHLSPMPDTSLDGISIALPTKSGTWGLMVQQLTSSQLTRTDETGEMLGTFDYGERSLTMAGGRNFGHTSVGFALRGIWQSLDEQQHSGYELIAGLQQVLAPGWQIGVVASHLWRTADMGESVEPPLVMQAGLSYTAGTFAVHAGAARNRVMLGATAWPLDGLELRAAAERINGELDYRLGLAVTSNGAALEYAYLGGGSADLPEQLPLGHVVSVRFPF